MENIAHDPFVSVDFEVFGKVQGVNFPKCCRELCDQWQVVGWIKNTKKGTICGKIQGRKSSIDTIINWLSHVGSPGSKIERCEFTNWQTLARPDFQNFSIRF